MKLKKQKRSKISLYIVACFIFVLMCITAAFYFVSNRSGVSQPSTHAVETPLFSFAKTDEWWQGATNHTSMAVFNYDRTNSKSTASSCFVSTEYKEGTVDTMAELDKINSDLKKSGYNVQALAAKNVTLRIDSDEKSYTLHQSKVTSPSGSEKLKEGQEFGYIQRDSGYIKVMGYCDSAKDLDDTLPALKSITYTSTN